MSEELPEEPKRDRPMPELFSQATRIDHVDLPVGARLAGGFLLLNVLVIGLERALLPNLDLPSGSAVSLLIDIFIGGMLVAGKGRVLTWAQVRIILGALLFGGRNLMGGLYLAAFFQVVFSVGLLLLIIGSAGKARAIIGSLICALYFGLEGLGLVATLTGVNPVGQAMLSADAEEGPAGTIAGTAAPYRLTLPNEKWRKRKKASFEKENPLADYWLMRPDRDAHVLVIAEETVIDLDIGELRDGVIQSMGASSTAHEVIDEGPLTSASGASSAHLIHARRTINQIEIEGYYAIFVGGGYAYQVMTFTTRAGFPQIQAELRQAIDGFRITPAEATRE